jgi:hypothetical protein
MVCSDPVSNAADIVVVADVEQARLNVGPCFAREARGVVKRMLIDMPDQKQARALTHKGMRDAASDATAGAGNERDLSFEFPHRPSTHRHKCCA